MKRDWIRIKNLLIAIEGEENTLSKYLEWWTDAEYKAQAAVAEYETITYFKLKAKERMLPVIKHHLELMRDGGLIDGICDFDDLDKSTVRLTMKGYDLLGLMRYCWKDIKEILEASQYPITLDAIMAVGNKLLLDRLK